MKMLKWASAIVALCLVFYMLYITGPYIVPLVLAVVFSFLIVMIADGYGSIAIRGHRMPGWLAMTLAMATIGTVFYLIGMVLNSNIREVIATVPCYQQKLIKLYDALVAQAPPALAGRLPRFDEMLAKIDLAAVLSLITSFLRGITENLGKISIFTAFILWDRKRLGLKLDYILRKRGKEEKVKSIIAEIKHDVKRYFVVKTAVSVLTGILSFTVMLICGLDFALLWAILACLLNFVPTVGSIVAVTFPVVLSLVQFDGLWHWHFFVITLSLITIHLVIGNFIDPKLMGKSLNLSPLVILLSLVLWGAIWGVTGAFLCVIITSIINITLAKFESTRDIAIMLSADGKIAT